VLVATAGADATMLTVISPAEVAFSEPGLFLFEGRIGSLLQGRLSWSNSLTGLEEMLEVAEDWAVMLPVGIGLNRLTFRATTAQGEVVTFVAPDVMVPGDLDGDEMDDWWEMLHFGSIEACDPDEDPDGDGFSNLMEWKLGTLPLDASSRFEVTSFQWGGGDDFQHVVLTWPTVPGKSYRLMGSASLVEPDWMNLADLTALDESSTMLYFLPEGTKRLFFRVELVEEAEPMMARAATGHGPAAMLPTAMPVETPESAGFRVTTGGAVMDAMVDRSASLAGQDISPAVIAGSADGRSAALSLPGVPAATGVPGGSVDGSTAAGIAPRVASVRKDVRSAVAMENPTLEGEVSGRVAGAGVRRDSSTRPESVAAVLVSARGGSVPALVQQTVVSEVPEVVAILESAGWTLDPSTSFEQVESDPLSSTQPARSWLSLGQLWEWLIAWLQGWLAAASLVVGDAVVDGR